MAPETEAASNINYAHIVFNPAQVFDLRQEGLQKLFYYDAYRRSVLAN